MKSGFVTFLTLAAVACAGAAKALEAESGDTAAPAAENTNGEPAKRRGRPAGSTNAAPAAEKPTKPAGPSIEDLKAVAIPYIKKGGSAASEEVKKLITEHGGTCISDVPEENRAAFQQDLEALAI